MIKSSSFIVASLVLLQQNAKEAAAFTSTPHATRSPIQSVTHKHTKVVQPLFVSIDPIEEATTSSPSTYGELSNAFTTLPRHSINQDVNDSLEKIEQTVRRLYKESIDIRNEIESSHVFEEDPVSESDKVYANSYVDLGKVEIVGFDYDYTLVTYRKELLRLIYDMALKRLVNDANYPDEMLDAGMKFDPKFSVRGLAVDRETGWICHLSYTHKVAVAYEGRKKVSRERLMKEYTGKRALKPTERKKRLKPLNDLFSMAECCLIADVVQFFKDRDIPFCPRNLVVDILGAIGSTHISGDFHRLVAAKPEVYFEDNPHLKEVLQKLKDSGKRMIFVSNSPFWYVDAGMKYVIGDQWQDMWDAVVVSAGKPRFYTETTRPFREVNKETNKMEFKRVDKIEQGKVYSDGCLTELTKCLDWYSAAQTDNDMEDEDLKMNVSGGGSLTSPNVLYIGDSLFADLVDAKRDFGWTTAAVTPEVMWENDFAEKVQFTNAQNVIDLLLLTLKEVQDVMGNGVRSKEDIEVITKLERMVAMWREQQNTLLGNPFGSVFRAKYQPSLFAHSLRRYCDLYMPNISALRHYSPQHRFYPEDARLLSHEIQATNPDCWDL
jgi:HAD superfamily 5'-nucleotidase-like hydrolase